MISFDNDPKASEQQLRAIIYYLTAFGHIDGAFFRDALQEAGQ